MSFIKLFRASNSPAPSGRDFFFTDPRLEMTWVGRTLVRIVSAISYLVVIVACVTFLFSDLLFLKWLGVLLALILLDRGVHLGQADKPLTELPESGRINLAS